MGADRYSIELVKFCKKLDPNKQKDCFEFLFASINNVVYDF